MFQIILLIVVIVRSGGEKLDGENSEETIEDKYGTFKSEGNRFIRDDEL